jgi:LacI family transcriptional regulator
MTTIIEVAKHAEVSIKTVSRVVNNEPKIREATRAKVMKAIEELGYVANISAKRLVTGNSYAIGVVFHNASWHYIQDVLKAVLETAQVAGYTIVLHSCDATNNCDLQEVVQLALQRQIDGVIFTPPADNAHDLLVQLDKLNIPFVRLTPSDRDTPWPYVTATDERGAYEMTKYLLSIGHRRIGYVMGPPAQKAAFDRFAGYKAALAEFQVEFDPTLVKQGDDHFEAGAVAARELLSVNAQARPSAIFCNNDEMAAGVNACVFDMGLRVPEDVSVAGFDDIALASQIWPPLTTVCQPINNIARTATDILIGMLNNEELTSLRYEIPTKLVLRKSVRPYRPQQEINWRGQDGPDQGGNRL